MGQAMTDRLSGLSTGNAGALLGAAVLAVVAVALVLTVTGVAEGEVVATLLFLPVFAAGLLAGRTAGYGAAGVATAAYVLLRRTTSPAPAWPTPGSWRSRGRARTPWPATSGRWPGRSWARAMASRPGAEARPGRARAGIRPGRWRGTSRGRPSDHRRERTTTAPDPCWSGSGRLRAGPRSPAERTGTVTVR